jgi:hypothetical protein
VKEKSLEGELGVEPPGPFALTRPSYVTLTASGAFSRATKLTRILPSLSGAGLPRSTVCVGVETPAT